MKILAVDMQGFYVNSQFYVKELAISSGVGGQQNHYLFEAPTPYNSLSSADKKTVNHVTSNVHGLRYSTGYVSYDKINEIIKSHICNADIVYVRGHQKLDFLESKFWEMNLTHFPLVRNVDNDDSVKFEKDLPMCMNHLPDKKFMCSLRNCDVLHKWLCDSLPK